MAAERAIVGTITKIYLYFQQQQCRIHIGIIQHIIILFATELLIFILYFIF